MDRRHFFRRALALPGLGASAGLAAAAPDQPGVVWLGSSACESGSRVTSRVRFKLHTSADAPVVYRLVAAEHRPLPRGWRRTCRTESMGPPDRLGWCLCTSEVEYRPVPA